MLFLSPFFFCLRGSGDAFRALGCSGEIAPSGGEKKSGGWNCRGRVEMFALCLELLVGVCRIAFHRQNRPPGTGASSGDRIALLVGLGSAGNGCFAALGRIQLSWEGGSDVRGWESRGRVELFALCLKALVGGDRIALPGQNHPPERY